MSTRRDALTWLQKNRSITSGHIFTSKYYTAEHAWPKQDSWWFEIPLQRLEENARADFHLLCQKTPDSTEFYHLKVPADYFLNHLDELTIQKSGKLSLFPAADALTRFKDLRGRGRVKFSSFLVKT